MRTDTDTKSREALRFLTEAGSRMTPEQRAAEMQRLAPQLRVMGCKVGGRHERAA